MGVGRSFRRRGPGQRENIVEQGSYGQFCPVAMAAEVFCTRWTALVLREILCGSTRFNDIRRGVPRMSPTLLSKRLKELQKAGIIQTRRAKSSSVVEYALTESGEDLRPLVMSLGMWGQRWVESKLSLKNLDPSLLMWDMRRHLDPTPLPEKLCTIHFEYPDLGDARRHWWLVIDKGFVDLCLVDPGHEIDLTITGSLRAMTAVWMGVSTVQKEADAGALDLHGDPKIARSMQKWLGLSPFAKEKSRVDMRAA
jgi:DNA-binding HxlR family transcriptional regulator